MPQDLYRWELDGAVLVHHCPVCDHSLSNGRARTKCLGEHVECCKAYHPQLHRKGHSHRCLGCKAASLMHNGRHRKIAEIRRKLLEMQSNQDPAFSTKITKGQRSQKLQDSPNATTKRQRKELKKTKKAAERSIAVTKADIDDVVAILYPSSSEEGEESKAAPVPDEEIHNNLPFNPNTDRDRDLRRALIAHDNDMSEYSVPDKVVLDCIFALGVKRRGCPKKGEERDLLDLLEETIRKELQSKGREDQEMTKRKAGFWRWANNTVHDKFVDIGMICEGKRRASLPTEEAVVTENDNMIDAEDRSNNDIILPIAAELEALALNASSDNGSVPSLNSTATTINTEDEKATLIPPPIPTFKPYCKKGMRHSKSTPYLRKQF